MLALFAFIDSARQPRVVSSTYNERSFGNAVVELEGDLLRIRVKRDRSQLFVDLSPPDRFDWVDEHIVLHFVGAGAEAEALVAAEWRELAPSVEAIERHLDRILESFRVAKWSLTREVLTRMQEERGRRLFGGP